MFFQGFLVLQPSNFESKLTKKRPQTDQKSSKKIVSILIPFLMDFGSNLSRFWEGFGGQVGTKLAQKSIKKMGQHLDPFFDGTWDQLGSILGRFWRPSWNHVGTKCQQNPTPKPIKKNTTFWKASGWILGGFWLPSWPPRT